MVGGDLAKSVFQIHAMDAEGAVTVRRKRRRSRMLAFFQLLAPCMVGMEACAGAHHWARELGKLGHEVRQMPPSCVKPRVRRCKTDQADAEVICEAVSRPTMRILPVKSEGTKVLLMTHKARAFLVRLLTQVANAIRAPLGGFGITVPKECCNVGHLLEAGERANLPTAARVPPRLPADQFFETCNRNSALTKDIRGEAEASDAAEKLQTSPGIGPAAATALVATLPDKTGFRTSRDLSARLGPTSKSHSSAFH